MDSSIPQEVRERILLAVQMSHRTNLERTRALDAKFRALYCFAAGAINDVSEEVRDYGKVVASLDLRQ